MTEVVSTESSQYLAKLIAYRLGVSHRHTVRKVFGDSEKYYRLDITDARELAGKDVVFVASTHTDDDLLELYRVGSTLADMGTRRRIFVIPFLGYSTMERAVNPGEIVTAKYNVRLLSSIPSSGMGNIFLFLDLHKPGLVHYFEDSSLRQELSAVSLLGDAISTRVRGDFVLASADLGMLAPVQALSERFGMDVAFVHKKRNFTTTKVLSVVGDVKGKQVVIYDDMVRSGGSLIQASEAYLHKGAKSVMAVVSHLALNNVGVAKELKQSAIETIISTNSHPMSEKVEALGDNFFTIADISPIYTELISDYLS